MFEENLKKITMEGRGLNSNRIANRDHLKAYRNIQRVLHGVLLPPLEAHMQRLISAPIKTI